jgi:hypothetical protein
LGITHRLKHEEECSLAELRASLLRCRCPNLDAGQGEEAFDQHLLLAVALHRVVRLHKLADSKQSDKDGWVDYVTSFFPRGRNAETTASWLWEGWRCSLLKDERPIVPISHGNPQAHWRLAEGGKPYVNLESLWADYEYSVDQFLEHLRRHPDRRQVALARWKERSWTVQMVAVAPVEGATQASCSTSSASAIAP